MLLPLEYKQEFIDFTNENIDFHTQYKKYRINNMWLDEIGENYFHDRINEFIEGLKVILISNNNNLLIVDELLTILQHKILFFSSSIFQTLINDSINFFIVMS